MTSIQAAMDTVALGGTVRVAAGTYNEAIDFRGRDIRVVGAGMNEGGSFLDGGGVTFSGGETQAAVLEGFRIRVGVAGLQQYEAVKIFQAEPTLRYCQIEAHNEHFYGLQVNDGDVFASHCRFGPFHAWCEIYGVDLRSRRQSTFTDCVFADCGQVKGPSQFIYCRGGAVTFRRCLIEASDDGVRLEDGDFIIESCALRWMQWALIVSPSQAGMRASLRLSNTLIHSCDQCYSTGLSFGGNMDVIVDHCTLIQAQDDPWYRLLTVGAPATGPASFVISNSLIFARNGPITRLPPEPVLTFRNSMANVPITGHNLLPGSFSFQHLDEPRLAIGSDAIDRALEPLCPLPATDVMGNPRLSYARRDLGAFEFLADNIIAANVAPVSPTAAAGPTQLLTIDTPFPSAFHATLFEIVTPSSTSTGPWAGLDLSNEAAAAQLGTFAAPFFAPLDARGDTQHLIPMPAGLPLPITVRGVTHALSPLTYDLLARGHFGWTWQ